MAFEILENNPGATHFVLAGIYGSGTVIAKNIQQHLSVISSVKVDFITLSLDKKHPAEVSISEPIDFNNKIIIVVDDVSNTGKTLLYALKPLLAYHPAKIQVLVLVERSYRAFPVHPDYVGLSFSTTPEEHIYVETDGDAVKGAYIM
jgi:pyrimidine operon attenuation protein/uracil phosphoribosyltransferase